MRRQPDFLDKLCEHEILIYVGGICAAIAALALVILWRS